MAASKPILYLIRHGEKPPKIDGKDQVGLSAQGLSRAQGLPNVFGKQSVFNIHRIFAQHPKQNGDQDRPFKTVEPLSKNLGLKIHSDIHRDDVQDIADAAKAYDGPGNVLVCWEHGQLSKIADAMGVQGYADETGWNGDVKYPDSRFDLIWTIEYPYDSINAVTSEGVQGLDKDQTGTKVLQADVEGTKDGD